MPDDIKLPGLGKVDKKWVLIGGAGALGLYEKVGMKVTSVWLSRAIDL